MRIILPVWSLMHQSLDSKRYQVSSCQDHHTNTDLRASLSVQPTNTGFGAFYSPKAHDTLPKGTFISLYAGEYLTSAQARIRWNSGYNDNYMLSLRVSGEIIHIDPRHHGNFGRFLNHSCDPNCVIQIVRWGGGHTWSRAAIFVSYSFHFHD